MADASGTLPRTPRKLREAANAVTSAFIGGQLFLKSYSMQFHLNLVLVS